VVGLSILTETSIHFVLVAFRREYVIYNRNLLENMEGPTKVEKKFVGEDIHIYLFIYLFIYLLKHQGRKRLTWRCTKERSLKCRGTMNTTFFTEIS